LIENLPPTISRGLLGEAPAASHDDRLVRSGFRAESAHAIDSQADHQNQANSAAVDDGAANGFTTSETHVNIVVNKQFVRVNNLKTIRSQSPIATGRIIQLKNLQRNLQQILQ
jgi:hypothetical protein